MRVLTLPSSQLDYGVFHFGCFQLCTTLRVEIVMAPTWGMTQ